MEFILRSWCSDDAVALADIYARADADLLRNIPRGRDLAAAQSWLDRILISQAEGASLAFAVVASDSGTEFGSSPESRTETVLGNLMATGIDRAHSTAWISYWLAASARGRGLAAAGLRTLVDALHDDHGIHRLELGYRVNNPASAAVARGAGFLVEGLEREKLLYDGVRYDTEICARLAGDPRPPGRRLSIHTRPPAPAVAEADPAR